MYFLLYLTQSFSSLVTDSINVQIQQREHTCKQLSMEAQKPKGTKQIIPIIVQYSVDKMHISCSKYNALSFLISKHSPSHPKKIKE